MVQQLTEYCSQWAGYTAADNAVWESVETRAQGARARASPDLWINIISIEQCNFLVRLTMIFKP